MKRKKQEDVLWLGTAEANDIRLIAIAAEKPTRQAFIIGKMPFHPVPLKKLDSLYRTARSIFLPKKSAFKQKRKKA
jgi:hypothetical protein